MNEFGSSVVGTHTDAIYGSEIGPLLLGWTLQPGIRGQGLLIGPNVSTGGSVARSSTETTRLRVGLLCNFDAPLLKEAI